MVYNNMQQAPIGMFDSGVGGLTVWRELAKLLPNESIVYYADSGNCPYGSKSQDEIIALSDAVIKFLLTKNCKLIVVACNTATAMAIDYLRTTYPDILFVGMEPAIKPAAMNTKTGVIGILATAGTFKGRLFNETKERFASNLKIIVQVGEGLVELVEQGKTHTLEAQNLLKRYIDPMLAENADELVLGCTHYPFLADDIKAIAGDKLLLIDSAPAVAQRVFHLLEQKALLNNNNRARFYSFFSSKRVDVLQSILKDLNVLDYTLEELL